ncbi:TrkH family potassium uptake protein [Halospeciosus flavus]|uniref:TrkH family potassium uptake protein n=1 Tax=Halospeciosus flavus TaxID=3032283 RepID=A0ABD5Z5Q3_9EURY|nr:TrkH family potassium uptake protein [Halospeciosus flavus]
MEVRVDWRTSVGEVGTVLKWLVVPLLAPLVLAVFDGTPVAPFLLPLVLTGASGLALERLRAGGDIGRREAFLMVSLAWLVVALVGAVPFVVAGEGAVAHPVNALFESMSGVTTTGATVLLDFSVHSRAILLWRQILQWLGGLGILVLATAVLARLGVNGAQLMEGESQLQDVRRLTPHIRETARLLWLLYIALTALNVAVLYGLHVVGLAPVMTPFDAVAHALTTVSTAGFSPRPESLGAFSGAVQWATTLFMIVGATSFVLLYEVLGGEVEALWRSDEFHFYLVLLGVFTVGVTGSLVVGGLFATTPETLRHAAFQVASIVTTTGYASVDYNTWPPLARHLLFACLFLGGMAGSTTCSIKVVRWLVVLKGFRRDLFRSIRPELVRPVRLNGDVVDEETLADVYGYTLVSLLFFAFTAALVAADAARVGLALSEFEAMSIAAATFFNVGPAFGIAGPYGTYEGLPATTKAALTVLMWVGRIEIVPVLVLLTPSYWTS